MWKRKPTGTGAHDLDSASLKAALATSELDSVSWSLSHHPCFTVTAPAVPIKGKLWPRPHPTPLALPHRSSPLPFHKYNPRGTAPFQRSASAVGPAQGSLNEALGQEIKMLNLQLGTDCGQGWAGSHTHPNTPQAAPSPGMGQEPHWDPTDTPCLRCTRFLTSISRVTLSHDSTFTALPTLALGVGGEQPDRARGISTLVWRRLLLLGTTGSIKQLRTGVYQPYKLQLLALQKSSNEPRTSEHHPGSVPRFHQ